MIHTANTVRTLQAVALSVGIALLLWSTGLPSIFRTAEAASVTDASDTLSNSKPSTVSNHTIQFTTPNGMLAGQTFTLTFPNAGGEFTIPSLGVEDFDLNASGTPQTLAGSNGSGIWGVSTSSNVITFTSPSNVQQASSTILIVRIGSNATTSGAGDSQIVNPTATTSFAIDIGGNMQDSGQVRVAIVEEVVVTASVDTSLTFVVAGVNSSSTVNSSPTTTIATTTYASLPFGNLPIGASRVLAQDLTITTNASNGYTVTVVQDGDLTSGTGDTIDGFVNGNYTPTPTAWTPPTALIADPDTYGHWGLTSNDASIAARSSQFGSDQWVSGSTTPIAIMGHTGPALATTTRIGYQVEISALQEAGEDYQTRLRYIATPVF